MLFAALATMTYCLMILGLRCAVEGDGFRVGGPVSYDTYYPYAFAQELKREGAFWSFRNPFGSLDDEPRLSHAYASALRPLAGLFGSHPFLFDLLLGALFLALGSHVFHRLFAPMPSWLEATMLAGGGVGFVLSAGGWNPSSTLLGTAFWGLTPLLNGIATPEIVYFSTMMLGLYGLVRSVWWLIPGVCLILVLLHPFTASLFLLLVVVNGMWEWRRGEERDGRVLVASGACWILGAWFVHRNLFHLPRVSRDAAFFKETYSNVDFTIPFTDYVLFLLPVLSLLIWSSSRVPRPSAALRILLAEDRRAALSGALLLGSFVLTFSHWLTPLVPQPAHWSRAYPFSMVVGLLASIHQRWPGALPRSKAAWSIVTVALLDSVLAVGRVGDFLTADHRPPYVLDGDQAEILDQFREGSGDFVYLRQCRNRQGLGDLEYALMARTQWTAGFGHHFFSPEMQQMSEALIVCSGDLAPRAQDLVHRAERLIIDKPVKDVVPVDTWDLHWEGERLAVYRRR
jgi:hypothetical protein